MADQKSAYDLNDISDYVDSTKSEISWTFSNQYKLKTVDFASLDLRLNVGTTFPKTWEELEKSQEVANEKTGKKVWMKVEEIVQDNERNGAFSKRETGF